MEKTRVAHLCTKCNFLYFLPAEYGSCLSTDRNSFLSYLARIHCSRRSLHAEHWLFTYCVLALITATHTQDLTRLICPFVSRVCFAFSAAFFAFLASNRLGKDKNPVKGERPRGPIPSRTQFTFRQDFVSRRANGRSPQEPLHTQWLSIVRWPAPFAGPV